MCVVGGYEQSLRVARLRVGWLVTRHQGLHKRLCQLKDYTTICASAPSEILALIGLRNRDTIVDRSMSVIRDGLAVELIHGGFRGYIRLETAICRLYYFQR